MARTAEEWAEKIEADRERVFAMQADFKAGRSEVETAREHGFATRGDLNDLLSHFDVKTDGATSWSTK